MNLSYVEGVDSQANTVKGNPADKTKNHLMHVGGPMERELAVFVDQTSWPTPPNSPAFPAAFTGGAQSFDLNIPILLLAIGYLTTPSHASGVSLSEFWAWVRYLHAISDDPDLRLTPAFFELDAHQKTILSDDFGMGAPICWLMDRLQLGPIADGRYFIDRVAASVGATATKPKKRGPGKSADFVARDANGIWHIGLLPVSWTPR